VKALLEQGKRYAVEIRLPEFVSPKLAIAMLKRDVASVIIVSSTKHSTRVEVTWRGKTREVSSAAILSAKQIG
jgi:uncharacterized protein YecE (DUF72 family)